MVLNINILDNKIGFIGIKAIGLTLQHIGGLKELDISSILKIFRK